MPHKASPDCHKGLAAAGSALLLAALLSGCSSSGSPAGGSSSSSSGSSTKTITVGYTNTESSGNSLPEWRYGGQAAINYINAHGGINGAQIKPVFCYVDGSPEASINCANEFVDDHVALDFMGVDVGIDSALPVLQSAGIPVIGTVGTSTQLFNPDSFVLHGGNGPDVAALAQALKDVGAAKITFIDLSGLGAGATAAFEIAKAVAPRIGMRISELQVPVTNTDWTSVVASALADKPDGFILDLSEDGCTSVLQRTRTSLAHRAESERPKTGADR
jgi:branched-chain amino acid transport system substrate-binding protein